MLMPKKVKHRKVQRGRMKGKAWKEVKSKIPDCVREKDDKCTPLPKRAHQSHYKRPAVRGRDYVFQGRPNDTKRSRKADFAAISSFSCSVPLGIKLHRNRPKMAVLGHKFLIFKTIPFEK